MLKLRPSCECCNVDLPPADPFECTFCARCAHDKLAGICPNCGGELVRRPVRPASKLAAYPATTERVFKPQGCAAATAQDG